MVRREDVLVKQLRTGILTENAHCPGLYVESSVRQKPRETSWHLAVYRITLVFVKVEKDYDEDEPPGFLEV